MSDARTPEERAEHLRGALFMDRSVEAQADNRRLIAAELRAAQAAAQDAMDEEMRTAEKLGYPDMLAVLRKWARERRARAKEVENG